jgi:hypothetical protein
VILLARRISRKQSGPDDVDRLLPEERLSAPSVDVASAGSRLVSLVGVAGNVTVSPPGGMTGRAELVGGTGSTKTVTEASDAAVGPGASGVKTATASRSARQSLSSWSSARLRNL